MVKKKLNKNINYEIDNNICAPCQKKIKKILLKHVIH